MTARDLLTAFCERTWGATAEDHAYLARLLDQAGAEAVAARAGGGVLCEWCRQVVARVDGPPTARLAARVLRKARAHALVCRAHPLREVEWELVRLYRELARSRRHAAALARQLLEARRELEARP